MTGHRKFQSLRGKLTPAQRERSKARVSELQKEQLLAEPNTPHFQPTPEDAKWLAKLRELVELHPDVTQTVDDSRESIYPPHSESNS